MSPADFHAPEAGHVVRVAHGGYAFVPAPLPPAITRTAELVRRLSRPDQALSELSGLGRHLPDPHILIAPYVRREALLSSRINGTRTVEALRGEVTARLVQELQPSGQGVSRRSAPALSQPFTLSASRSLWWSDFFYAAGQAPLLRP